MSVLETILIYVLVPAALFLAISMLGRGPSPNRAASYRPGEQWAFDPVWWTANPEGLDAAQRQQRAAGDQGQNASGSEMKLGGSRGSW